MLDGAPCPDARARRAHHGGRARPDLGSRLWAAISRKEVRGAAHRWRGRGVVGRGELMLARASGRAAPRALTVPNELTKGCLWGGSAPPNGSRLSCGA